MANQRTENAGIDWEEVIVCLQAYARWLVKGKGWFRGEDTTTFLKGQEIDDYVFGAIEKYLRHPEKHDPAKGSLVDYLRYNLIRTMVSNNLKSAENRTSQDVFALDEGSDGEESTSYLDAILPHAQVFFDQELDYDEVMRHIESELKSDKIVESIFLGINGYGLKRREIIKEFELTEKEYDNGMRRLTTILNNVAKKFDIKAPIA